MKLTAWAVCFVVGLYASLLTVAGVLLLLIVMG